MEHKEIYNVIEGSKFYKRLLRKKESAEKKLNELNNEILVSLNKRDYEEVSKLGTRAKGYYEIIQEIEDTIDDLEWEFNNKQE